LSAGIGSAIVAAAKSLPVKLIPTRGFAQAKERHDAA
jgi:hypothetical protein